MPLRGRIQWSLLATTLVSGILAFVFAARGDVRPDDPSVIGSTTTTSTTTTTVYTAPVRYVVQRGDTLYSIAETFRVDMRALMDLNDIT
ncbi:MAG: LysM peptidoglycan-binding domain-containing protein, partial [Acidimicrobiia bacterium]